MPKSDVTDVFISTVECSANLLRQLVMVGSSLHEVSINIKPNRGFDCTIVQRVRDCCSLIINVYDFVIFPSGRKFVTRS